MHPAASSTTTVPHASGFFGRSGKKLREREFQAVASAMLLIAATLVSISLGLLPGLWAIP